MNMTHRRAFSRRTFLQSAATAVAIRSFPQPRSCASSQGVLANTCPTVDTIIALLGTKNYIDALDWIPFVDDPMRRTQKELWRLILEGKYDFALHLYFWRIVAALASGGTEIATSLFEHFESEKEALKPLLLGDGSTWLRAAAALACIARAGQGNSKIATRFQDLVDQVAQQQGAGRRHLSNNESRVASSPYLRAIEHHLEKRECDDLSCLGLNTLAANLSRPAQLIWMRTLELLYAIGPCDWLGEVALQQVSSRTIDLQSHPGSGDYGLCVLAQLGPRGHLGLRDVDAVVRDVTNMERIPGRLMYFVLLHALASTAANREEAPHFLRQACLHAAREKLDRVPSSLRCGMVAPGIMNQRMTMALVDALVTLPLIQPAFTPFAVLHASGRYASAACAPVLEYLRRGNDDTPRRRLAAVALLSVVDSESLPLVASQLEIETDPLVTTVLQRADRFVATLDPELFPDVNPNLDTGGVYE
jgi:hypothetical protein